MSKVYSHRQRDEPETPGRRLKNARIEAGYATAAVFSRKHEIGGKFYRAHENSERVMTIFDVQKYSNVFVKEGHPDITPAWLMWGQPSMSEPHRPAGEDLVAAEPHIGATGMKPKWLHPSEDRNETPEPRPPQRLEIEVLDQGYLITVGPQDGIDDFRRWACRDPVDLCSTLVQILNPVVPMRPGSMVRAERAAVNTEPNVTQAPPTTKEEKP